MGAYEWLIPSLHEQMAVAKRAAKSRALDLYLFSARLAGEDVIVVGPDRRTLHRADGTTEDVPPPSSGAAFRHHLASMEIDGVPVDGVAGVEVFGLNTPPAGDTV